MRRRTKSHRTPENGSLDGDNKALISAPGTARKYGFKGQS